MEFVQLRAKGVHAGELAIRARKLMAELAGGDAKLLVNGRADVAVAVGAHGVHLTGAPDELTAEQVRRVFAVSGLPRPVVSKSCHSLEDVRRAAAAAVDLILFGPVFEKRLMGEGAVAGVGLGHLRSACTAAEGVPVLALGGINATNVEVCLRAGASGVAGIRMFAR
jgi:thiamine-phosphate pyrophosphorylase